LSVEPMANAPARALRGPRPPETALTADVDDRPARLADLLKRRHG